MSAFITLAEARAAIEHLIVTDDFVSLVNRGAERLYRRGASPGFLKELTLPTPDAEGLIPTTFADKSHILAFKVDSKAYVIIPVEATYKQDGSGTHDFVDMGYATDTTRVYRIPDILRRDDGDYSGCVWKALYRPAYVDVVDEADTLPFQHVDPLKLSVLAIQHEDNSDLASASEYMQYALGERESDSREFRGPQVIDIGFHDPASHESTHAIN